MRSSFAAACGVSVAVLLLAAGARAQEPARPASVALVVEAGRPLRITVPAQMTVRRVGQPITGTLLDPIYTRDRVVVPAGATVRGHVSALEPATRLARLHAMLSGDFSPHRRVIVEFDALVSEDGHERPIHTSVHAAAERLVLNVAASDAPDADADEGDGIVSQARDRVAQARRDAVQRARATLAAIRNPGRVERLKLLAIEKLPYHPQYVPKGTVYDAELVDAIDFGTGRPIDAAPPGSMPAPSSVLTARLASPLDSAHSARGDRVEAVLAEPVFSADHAVILPEGSRLVGTVTASRAARRLHRNGRLRFLFESVEPPGGEAATMLASLYSVQLADADAVSVDDEGGTRATSSRTRFIPPALAVLALRGVTHREARKIDNDADDSLPGPVGNPGSRGVGGFLGFGIAGAVVSQFAHPVGIALTAVGVARTTYSAVFGKGRDVTFPADTLLQVQLAPGPTPEH